MPKALAGVSALGTACRPDSASVAIMKGARRMAGATIHERAGGRLRGWRCEDEIVDAPPRERCPTGCQLLVDDGLGSQCPGRFVSTVRPGTPKLTSNRAGSQGREHQSWVKMLACWRGYTVEAADGYLGGMETQESSAEMERRRVKA